MTPSESISTWLVDWRLVNIIGDVLPPRDPNDDEEEEDDTGSRFSSESVGFGDEVEQSFRRPCRWLIGRSKRAYELTCADSNNTLRTNG